ncbi:MAG TPA: CBS domain-containing protein [Candidatus Binatia bacterium]|nr:CBS domain-containing protein [Candidatus Binatia bacterium]
MQVKDILRTNYLSAKPDDTLASVFGKLGRGKHTEAVIVDGKGIFIGMLNKRALIRSRIDASETKVKGFVAKTATLTEDMVLEQAARLMHAADFHVLPVVDKNKHVLGIAGARDLLDAVQGTFTQSARELGTMKLITLQDSDPVSKAVGLFHKTGIDHIPLVDEQGRLTGIASFVDLVARFHLSGARGAVSGRKGKHGRTSASGQDSGDRPNYDSLPLQNVMTRLVVTASPNAKVQQIIKLLRDNEISDIVLVEDERPVGIITSKDLLREVA